MWLKIIGLGKKSNLGKLWQKKWPGEFTVFKPGKLQVVARSRVCLPMDEVTIEKKRWALKTEVT